MYTAENEQQCLSRSLSIYLNDWEDFEMQSTDENYSNPFDRESVDENVTALILESSDDLNHPFSLFDDPVGVQQYLDQLSNASPIETFKFKKETSAPRWFVRDRDTGRDRRPFLYEFIRILLDNEEFHEIAAYVDQKRGVFKFFSTEKVAQLWKQVKGRTSGAQMTYEKLARAIRYYYHTGIMSSHPGRYTFRFGPKSGFGIDWNVGDFTQN